MGILGGAAPFGAVACVVALLAGGCGGSPETPPAAVSTQSPVAPGKEAPAAVADTLDGDQLLARASEALRGQRLHTPAGDNAVEYYLALRERGGDDAAARAALVELQPYLMVGAEQAIATDDVAEAGRLLALMARVDGDAPALPRLRGSLAATVERIEAGENQAGADDVAEEEAAPAEAGPAPVADAGVASSGTVQAPPPALDPQAPATAGPDPSAAPVAAAAPPDPAVTTSTAAAEPAGPPGVAAIPPPVAAVEAAPPPPSPREPPVPRLLQDVAPEYPLMAMARRVEGRVRLAITIEPDGSVSDVEVESAQPSGVFDRSAIEAARRWRFEAGPAQVRISRSLNFSLTDAR